MKCGYLAVYLNGKTLVNVTGSFQEGATVGVSINTGGQIITNGYKAHNPNADADTYFHSDKTSKNLTIVDDELILGTFVTFDECSWDDENKVVVTNGQTVKPGDALVNIRSQLATAVLRAPEAGVVLTALTPNSNFTKREPLVWLLPQATAMHEREVLAYVTFKDLRKVKRGAQVQVTPSDLEREKWGYATGRVVDIAAYPTNRKAVADKLKLAELASFIPEGETVYEVWSKRYIWQVLLGQAENTLNSIQGK